MKYAFFKGCYLPVRLPHIEFISKKILIEFGIKLQEVDGFSCCPEPVGFYSIDKLAGTAVAARNISLAEEIGLDLITLCNGCTYTLRQVNMTLKQNDELRDSVNEILAETGHQFKGTVSVKHFTMVLKDDLGFDKVEKKVMRSLEGLNIAGHTGCHIVSPPEFMRFDDPLDPVVLDDMVRLIGADPLEYDLKTLCCGWTLTNYGDKDAANKLLGEKLGAMKYARADCITTICPQCFYQFDTGQILASRSIKFNYKIPVLFYTQLLALAMGYSLDDIGYQRHRVRDQGFEERIRSVTS